MTLPKAYYSIRETAQLLGVSDQHVSNLLIDGELEKAPDIRRAGATKSLTRIPRESIRDFIERRIGGDLPAPQGTAGRTVWKQSTSPAS